MDNERRGSNVPDPLEAFQREAEFSDQTICGLEVEKFPTEVLGDTRARSELIYRCGNQKCPVLAIGIPVDETATGDTAEVAVQLAEATANETASRKVTEMCVVAFPNFSLFKKPFRRG